MTTQTSTNKDLSDELRAVLNGTYDNADNLIKAINEIKSTTNSKGIKTKVDKVIGTIKTDSNLEDIKTELKKILDPEKPVTDSIKDLFTGFFKGAPSMASTINIISSIIAMFLMIGAISVKDNQALMITTLAVSSIVRVYQLIMLFNIFAQTITLSLTQTIVTFFFFYLNHCVLFATVSYYVASNSTAEKKHYSRYAGNSTLSLSDMFQYIVSTSVLFTTTDVVAVSETAKIVGYFNAADSFVIFITFIVALFKNINTTKSNETK